jgi:hypothetical protein
MAAVGIMASSSFARIALEKCLTVSKTVFLKKSDSDDRCLRCFTRDEGRPFGVGLQGQAPNHHELRG